MTLKGLLKKRSRILYSQLLFTAFAFIIMVLLAYFFMSSIVRGNLTRNANNVLNLTEKQILSHTQEFEMTLKSFAKEIRGMVLRGDSADMIKKYINNASDFLSLISDQSSGIQEIYGYFETIPGGPVFIRNDHLYAPENLDPEKVRLNQQLSKSCNEIVKTKPRIIDGNRIFTYAKCLLDDQGHRLGFLYMDVNLNAIGQNIVDIALNQGGYGMLMNQDFLMLFHPHADFVGMNMHNPIIPISIFFDDLRGGKELFEESMISYKNEEAVTFFRKLSNGWYLGLVTPKSRYYRDMKNMMFILCLLGGTLMAILISILIRLDVARMKSDEESKKKSMFLANMSHEIRTPINAIVGMSAIGKTTGTLERKDYCFSKIDNASKHLLGVINDILDMSKIEANKIELFATNFNFEKMLQQIINVVNFRVDEKHQKLTVHIDKAIPPVMFGDDQRFAQVITNLLSNAIKFTPEKGAISLKTSLLGEDDGVYTVKVEVNDTGIGINPEQQSKLFQVFQQAESSTTRKYGGSGLGLSISKSIVEMMGGKIWVKSEFGKGATFAFTVKMKPGIDSRFNLNNQGINWKNIRILTVDEDPDVLIYFQEIVSNFGAKCEVAGNAEDALRLIDQNGAYNIYFIDLRMPGNGINLAQKIRAKEKKFENSIVIMVSSTDLNAIEEEAKKAGINKFLLKPLFPSAIADIINECIGVIHEQTPEPPLDINGIFAGQHILLAEDIDINREIIMTLLEPTLVEIDYAENGLEAVKMFIKTPEKYDMIFMDIQMPEMDGYEATRQIRALDLKNAKTVPIIAMTANAFKEDIENSHFAGMNDHLSKPLNINKLLETMFRYLQG